MKVILGLIKWSYFVFCTLMLIGGIAAHSEQESKGASLGLIIFFALCMAVILYFAIRKRVKKKNPREEHPEYRPFYYVAEEESAPKSFGQIIFAVIKWIFIVVKWAICALFTLVLCLSTGLYREGDGEVLIFCGVYVAAVVLTAIYNKKRKRRVAEEKRLEEQGVQYYTGGIR